MFHLYSVTNLFMLYMLVGIGPPMDRNLIRTDMLRVSAVIYSGISVIASIFFLWSLYYLSFNLRFLIPPFFLVPLTFFKQIKLYKC
jgi:hypothetical protein